MKIGRKFSLARLGEKFRFESVLISMSGEDVNDIIKRIDCAWQVYEARIKKGEVS